MIRLLNEPFFLPTAEGKEYRAEIKQRTESPAIERIVAASAQSRTKRGGTPVYQSSLTAS